MKVKIIIGLIIALHLMILSGCSINNSDNISQNNPISNEKEISEYIA